MIVFDLKCGGGHVFEAWFGSTRDWESQRERKLVVCPLCGDGDVIKAVMAPNVSAKSNARAILPVAAPAASNDAEAKQLMAAMAKAQAAMLEKSDWVGRDFGIQARAMHAGEVDHRPIHGEATVADAKAMVAEGVKIAPLPLPVTPPDALN